jgi:hypothetical protein
MCTQYNACIISTQEYAAKTERLQEMQLQVRQVAAAAGLYRDQTIGQQNIAEQNIGTQTTPPLGSPFPPSSGGETNPSDVSGGSGISPLTGRAPNGVSPSKSPKIETVMPSTKTQTPSNPAETQTGETIVNILQDGSKALRGIGPKARGSEPLPSQSISQPSIAPGQDLDAVLRSTVQSLKKNVAARKPAVASERAVVGNFTEENRPWSGPLGAILQDRVSAIVTNDRLFNQPTSVRSRGVRIEEVATVGNANDPKALTALYNSDLAITGTYQTQGDGVRVTLSASQRAGEIAQTSTTIPARLIPDVVAATPQNARETNELIATLNQIGPRADGQVNLTTNRPGYGSNFRFGEEIIYFVGSTTNGFLYLFHVDADKKVTRLFPNRYQRDARITGGQVLQLPAPGAPFRFEAEPPFGLETTFAVVTSSPLDEKDLQAIENSAGVKQDLPASVRSRGVKVGPATPSSAAPAASVLWNSVTVLIRP